MNAWVGLYVQHEVVQAESGDVGLCRLAHVLHDSTPVYLFHASHAARELRKICEDPSNLLLHHTISFERRMATNKPVA
jgi:hypothetical protein